MAFSGKKEMTDWKPGDPERRKCKVPMDCLYADQILEMHKAIYGNGTPTKGLYWMVEKNTEFISTVRRVFWPLAIGAMMGSAAAIVNLLRSTMIHLATYK